MNRKLSKLRAYLIDLQASVKAKDEALNQQGRRISELVGINTDLVRTQRLHELELAQKDEENNNLRREIQELEARLANERQLVAQTTRNRNAAESKAQHEADTRGATIHQLQLEIDALNLLNDDLQEIVDQKTAQINELYEQSSRKLAQAIQEERDRVKCVLEKCRMVLVKLSERISANEQTNSLTGTELRSKLDTIDSFREDIAKQKRAYAQWIELLRQQPG